MLHFRRAQLPYRWHLRSAQWDFPSTSTYTWWRNAWNDGIKMFRLRIRRRHDDDGNMHAKICDKRVDTPIPIFRLTSLWLIFYKRNFYYSLKQTKCFAQKYVAQPTCLENICNCSANMPHRPMYGACNRWPDTLLVFYARHTRISIARWLSSACMCLARSETEDERPIHSIPCRIACGTNGKCNLKLFTCAARKVRKNMVIPQVLVLPHSFVLSIRHS